MVDWGTRIRSKAYDDIGFAIEWCKSGNVFILRLLAESIADSDLGDYFVHLNRELLESFDYAEENGFTAFLWDMSEFQPELNLGNASGIILEDVVSRAQKTNLQIATINIHEEHQAAGRAFMGSKADLLFKPTDDQINAWVRRHSG